MTDDLDDMLESDAEMLKGDFETVRSEYRQVKHGDGVGVPVAVEMTLWGLAAMGLAFMLVALYFTGPDAYLTGEQWLAISLGWLAIAGGGALTIRVIRP